MWILFAIFICLLASEVPSHIYFFLFCMWHSRMLHALTFSSFSMEAFSISEQFLTFIWKYISVQWPISLHNEQEWILKTFSESKIKSNQIYKCILRNPLRVAISLVHGHIFLPWKVSKFMSIHLKKLWQNSYDISQWEKKKKKKSHTSDVPYACVM